MGSLGHILVFLAAQCRNASTVLTAGACGLSGQLLELTEDFMSCGHTVARECFVTRKVLSQFPNQNRPLWGC